MVACVFLAQDLSIKIAKSLILTQLMFTLFGSGYGLILISTSDRVYRQALKYGHADNIETYLVVSGTRR